MTPAIAVVNNGALIFLAADGLLTVFSFDGQTLKKVAEAPYGMAAQQMSLQQGGAPGMILTPEE